MGIQNKTYETRYFTYYLEFPDGEVWHRQTPFIHAIDFELKNMSKTLAFSKNPHVNFSVAAGELLRKGETKWRDHNGVRHIIRIETTYRQDRWGKQD